MFLTGKHAKHVERASACTARATPSSDAQNGLSRTIPPDELFWEGFDAGGNGGGAAAAFAWGFGAGAAATRVGSGDFGAVTVSR